MTKNTVVWTEADLKGLRDRAEVDGIPSYTVEALIRYVNHRLLPGGFLTAVLENNLYKAVGAADTENREALSGLVSLVMNRVPAVSRGSAEKVQRWLSGEEEDDPWENW